jgi:hypothetical protein
MCCIHFKQCGQYFEVYLGWLFLASRPFPRCPGHCFRACSPHDSVSLHSITTWSRPLLSSSVCLSFNLKRQRALAHALFHSFSSSMRASLSLNPESFTRRFAMIPCAAGSVFQTVDVMMNAPENASNFDWAFIFVNSSQQTSSDAEDRSIIRCANCRSIARKFFVRGPTHI